MAHSTQIVTLLGTVYAEAADLGAILLTLVSVASWRISVATIY